MKRKQEGGWVIGKKKIWSITYKDDVAIMANNEEEMKRIIKTYSNYLKKKGLELNVEKTKVMEFRKAGGRRKKTELFWEEGKKIEKVKEFKYLGYVLKADNSDEHIKNLGAKGKAKIGIVWSLGERKFKNSWKRRMRLFDALVQSVMMYGAEIWGWKKRERIEKMQERYLRWSLGVGFSTPGYAVIEETKRRRICLSASKRAIKFEVKMARSKGGSIRKECWKRWANERGMESGMGKVRKAFLVKRMWSKGAWKAAVEVLEKPWKEIEEESFALKEEEIKEKMNGSRYIKEQKELIYSEERAYLDESKKIPV